MKSQFREAIRKSTLSLHCDAGKSSSFRIEIRFLTRELYEAYRERISNNFPHNYLCVEGSWIEIRDDLAGMDTALYGLKDRGHRPPKWGYDAKVDEWLSSKSRMWLDWQFSPF